MSSDSNTNSARGLSEDKVDNNERGTNKKTRDHIAIAVSTMALLAIIFLVTSQSSSSEVRHVTTESIRDAEGRKIDHQTNPRVNSFSEVSTSTSKPNIVFILADDMAYNGIGLDSFTTEQTSLGKALTLLTPTLNGLAKDGVVIQNYYAQEVCTPSRASFLTGADGLCSVGCMGM
jgi:hypothetical protein